MPVTSVSAPLPQGTRPDVATETDSVLAKRVATAGLCRPGAASMTRIVFHHQVALSRLVNGDGDETDDPWFPATETGDRATEAARWACQGCPVRTECAVLAYREEVKTGDVHGVRGGLSAGERRDALRQFRTAEGGTR